MAINFPNLPSINDTYVVGNVTYRWDGSSWKGSSPSGIQGIQGIQGTQSIQGIQGIQGTNVATIYTNDTPPISPQDGDMWWDTTSATFYVYYDDGGSPPSGQWVVAVPNTTGAQGITGIQGIQGASGGPGTLTTIQSLAGGGSMASNLTISLVNDTDTPGNNYTYGTNNSGTRGWLQRPYLSRGAAFVSTSELLASTPPVLLHLARAATIRRVIILGDLTGSVILSMKTQTLASYTSPSSGSNICGTDYPTISSGVKLDKAAFTGWTTAVAADTVLAIGMSSVSGFTRLIIQIYFEEAL